VPVLAGWADLDQREADAGITARHPILIDPQYQGGKERAHHPEPGAGARGAAA